MKCIFKIIFFLFPLFAQAQIFGTYDSSKPLYSFSASILDTTPINQHPIKILHAPSMPYRDGGWNVFGFNNDYFQFLSNGSVGDSVYFPSDSIYQITVIAAGNYSRKQFSQMAVSVDDDSINSTVNTATYGTYDTFDDQVFWVTKGNHKVSIALINHTDLVNTKLKVGLIYIYKGLASAYQLPTLPTGIYPDSSQFFSVDAWMGGHLRGFNEGTEGTFHPTMQNNYCNMVGLGANIVRHHFTIILNKVTNQYQFEDGDIVRMDSILSWAKKYNYFVNIGFDQDPHSSAQLWWGKKQRERSITKLWKQIAKRYANNKFVAAYSPINEPTPAGRISEYLNWMLDIMDTIHSVDKNHCIVFPWAHDFNILNMMLPLPFNNIIYEYHMYDPFEITSQGINGFTQPNTYPSTGGDVGVYNKDSLYNKLNKIRDFQIKWNAPIAITEAGCVAYSPLNNDAVPTSTAWFTDVISIFEEYGWSWVVTSWRQSEIWNYEISPYVFYECDYQYAEPTCELGKLDVFSSDTTATMQLFINQFQKNK